MGITFHAKADRVSRLTVSGLTVSGSRRSLGISPLVAAVLLIAVTMTIAGILAYWATSFVRTSLPQTNETETECRFADFLIYSCNYYNSTQTLNFILQNYKDVELRSMKAFVIYPNSTVSNPINLNVTLPAGGTLKSFKIDNIFEDFSKIMITTQCPDISRDKTCTKM